MTFLNDYFKIPSCVNGRKQSHLKLDCKSAGFIKYDVRFCILIRIPLVCAMQRIRNYHKTDSYGQFSFNSKALIKRVHIIISFRINPIISISDTSTTPLMLDKRFVQGIEILGRILGSGYNSTAKVGLFYPYWSVSSAAKLHHVNFQQKLASVFCSASLCNVRRTMAPRGR